MIRVDEPPPKWSTLLVNVVRGRSTALLASAEIHHELAFQVNAFASDSVIGYVIQIAGRDQPSERHLAWRKGFPIAAAGIRSQSTLEALVGAG